MINMNVSLSLSTPEYCRHRPSWSYGWGPPPSWSPPTPRCSSRPWTWISFFGVDSIYHTFLSMRNCCESIVKPDSSWFWLLGDEDDISQTGHLTNAQWKVFFLWFSIMFCKIALDGGDSWLMTIFRCHYIMVAVLMKGLKPLCCSMTHSYWTLTRA